MIFANVDSEPPLEKDIRNYPFNPENPEKHFININILSPNLDPMVYSILLSKSELGW